MKNVKDKKNRLFFRFFLVFALVTALTMPTDISGSSAWAATPASGSCGTNVTYTFDSTTGVLTISGTGNMKDYSNGSSPFYGKDDIKSVVISDGVLNIGSYVFQTCTGMTSIEIADSVTAIGYSAFQECSSLTSINIPDSVLSIGANAFYNCSSMKSVRLSTKPTEIKEGTFHGCSSLKNIKIPDSVTSIKDMAFQNCSSLTSITLPDTMTSLGECVFMECGSLKSIKIPYGITMIGKFQFYNCDSLTSLIIPDSVTRIRDYAFRECDKLTTIAIPDSVTSIGEFEFYGCSSLTAIRYHGTKADWAQIDCKTDVSDLPMEYEYHPPGKILTSKNATCTSDGSVVYDCIYENCKYSIYEELPATGHSIVQHDGKEPTSTEPGWEPYETCRNCYYTTYKEIPATGPETISGELAVSITAPVTGQLPQTVIDAEKYTGSIHWTPETADQFAKDTEYAAEITLTPKDGYKFDSSPSITVNGKAAEGTVNEDGTLTFSVSFEATAALEYDGMQASKPEPVSKRAGKVVLEEQNIAEETVEYGYRVKDADAAYTWQDSSTFESLKAGIYDFAARVKENDVHSPGAISEVLNLEVFAKPVISYSDLRDLTVDTEIKDLVPALEGGSGTGTFAMEGVLPGGLSFDEETGIISGTPSTTGIAGSVSVKYTDSEGNVSDSVVVRYEGVKPIELKLNPEDIRLSYEKTIYDGTEKCPAVTINGLVQDQDYTVSYSNNIDAGTATVTITGKGNYTGTASRTFEILKGCTVSGQVKSYNPNNQVTIWLMQDGKMVYEGTIEASVGSGQVTQDFRIEGVAEGTYDLKVMKEGHLTYTIEGVVVGNEDLDLTASAKHGVQLITMLAGDMDGNGSINVNDLNTVWNAKNYNKSGQDPNVDPITDIDGNGSINVNDLNIVWNSANYNKGEKDCTVSYL